MRKLIISALVLPFLTACGGFHRATPLPVIVHTTPVPRATVVHPVINEAQHANTQATTHTALANQQADQVQAGLKDTTTLIADAVVKTTELKKAGSANSQQLGDLLTTLVITQQKVGVMTLGTASLRAELNLSKAQQEVVGAKLADADNLARSKEAEADSLRKDLNTERAISLSLEKKANDNAALADKNAAAANQSQGIIKEKNHVILWLWGAVAILVIACLLLGKLALKI